MSRPTASVPSGKDQEPPACQAGGSRNASRFCRVGSCGAITSAKMAASTTSTITASPATAPLFSLK